MDFRFTEDQLSIQAIARDFAQKRIAPVAAELDARGEFPLENIREMGQLGLMGIEVPEEYGGAGGSLTMVAIAVEEIVVQRCFQLLTSILRLAVTRDAACYNPKVLDAHVPRVLEIVEIIAQTRRMREERND